MSYFHYEKFKISKDDRYICPKCANRKINLFLSSTNSDVIYECKQCKYTSRDEFEHNYYTKTFDKLSKLNKKDLKDMLPNLKKQLKKEESSAESIWSSYGSELAGDFMDGYYEVQTKIKIIENILEDK